MKIILFYPVYNDHFPERLYNFTAFTNIIDELERTDHKVTIRHHPRHYRPSTYKKLLEEKFSFSVNDNLNELIKKK